MHRDQAAPAPSSAWLYRAAERHVRGWAGRYTSSAPLHYAQRRLASVDFELWEHADAMDRGRWHVLPGALTLVLRTVAGAPRDLRWRRSIRVGRAVHQEVPMRLVPMRHRRRTAMPLQIDRPFDQTNGVIAP